MAEGRTELLKVRLTRSEMAQLDEARGDVSRSDYARRMILPVAQATHYEKTAPPRHRFEPQKGNPLRCTCGQRQGAHGRA